MNKSNKSNRVMLLSLSALVLLAWANRTDGSTPGSSVISMPTVTIGDAGNAATASGYGAVNYEYQIGKYEVTSGQYAAFLNAVASVSDSYGLYNGKMNNGGTGGYGCGIERKGSDRNWTYTATAASKPVNFVSFYDAARFANWLTTGDTESGLYVFKDGVLDSVADHATSIGWAIASENEWYKAAYYKGDGGYSPYPNGTGNISGSEANYWGSGNGNNLIGVGSLVEEQNGTYDMAGNVWEWTDTLISGTTHVVRGGSCDNDASYSAASQRGTNNAAAEGGIGFRVVFLGPTVPEPSDLAVAMGVLMLGIGLWKRRGGARTL